MDFRAIFTRYREKRPSTIRSKAILIVLPVFLVMSLFYTSALVLTKQETVRGEIEKRARLVSEMVSLFAGPLFLSRKAVETEAALTSIEGLPGVVSVAVYDRQRSLLKGREWPVRRKPYGSEAMFFGEGDYYDVYVPIIDGYGYVRNTRSREQKEPLGWVRIVFSTTDAKEGQLPLIIKGLMAALFFSVAGGAVVRFLFSYAIQPLAQLSGAVKSIRKGFYPKVAVQSCDEVSDLADEFNRMSDALNKREEMLIARARLSKFSAEVAMALTEKESLDEMCLSCAEIFRTHSDSVCVGMWLRNAQDDTLQLQASAGQFEGDPFPVRSLVHGEGFAGMIAKDRQPFTSGNPGELSSLVNGEFVAANDISFFAGYPIIIESRLIGVLELYSRRPFCWGLLNAIGTLADQMAIGLERKIIEERMGRSLEEKEVLLREIHHRVKNNMQVISSLLNLQAQTVADPKYRDMFSDSKNRIRAMALIHEKLYQRPDIVNIDFGDYIASLANGLFMFYGISTSRVVLSIHVEDIVLGIDTAIPCGLIINELLSNALKYAFPSGKKGEIRISIGRNPDSKGIYTLIVSDNGTGLPNGFDIRTARSLGLHLVTSLAEHQLQGRMEVGRNGGTSFQIHFRDAGHKKRG